MLARQLNEGVATLALAVQLLIFLEDLATAQHRSGCSGVNTKPGTIICSLEQEGVQRGYAAAHQAIRARDRERSCLSSKILKDSDLDIGSRFMTGREMGARALRTAQRYQGLVFYKM